MGKGLGFRVVFFDSKIVVDTVDANVRKAMSKAGAFIRRSAQSSIKYTNGIAQAGSPPHAHRSRGYTKKKVKGGVTTFQNASPLRELIFFGWDARTKSVVVGPTPFRGKTEAPPLLEFGGTFAKNGKAMKYAPHPFMGPALKANVSKFPELLKNLTARK